MPRLRDGKLHWQTYTTIQTPQSGHTSGVEQTSLRRWACISHVLVESLNLDVSSLDGTGMRLPQLEGPGSRSDAITK